MATKRKSTKAKAAEKPTEKAAVKPEKKSSAPANAFSGSRAFRRR